jgi:hypothetical protein
MRHRHPTLAASVWLAAAVGCVQAGAVIDDPASGAPGTSGGTPTAMNPRASGTGGAPGAGGPAAGMDPAAMVPMAPTGSAPPAAGACSTPDTPGPRVLRRLTRDQLVDSVRTLLRDPAAPVQPVLDDPEALGFSSDAGLLVVRDLGAQQLMDQAEQIAHWAVTNRLDQIATCKTMDATCRQQIIRSFGRRALRAPLMDAQLKAYDALFAAETSLSDGVEAMVAAMLQSPYFLYRTELGAPDAGSTSRFTLTPFEVASSLSYLLTGTMPDDMLAAAADAGALGTADLLKKQVDRLLGDPRSDVGLMRFVTGWLGLDRLATVVKDDKVFMLTDQLRQDMLGETRALVTDTFKNGGGLADLMTAKYSFINKRLAQLYGVTATSDQLTKVAYTATQRDPGILAHGSILTGYATASGSSPVTRGKLVRTRLLCQDLPPPPANLDTMLKPPTSGQSTRDHFIQHSQNPVCNACHRMMDPIGFAFERYDGFGRHRDQENGKPIDSTGTLANADGNGTDVSFAGLADVGGYLAKSDGARSCLVRYWSYFAYGVATWADAACTYQSIEREAAKGNYSLRSVLAAMVTAPHFTRRVQDR